MVSASNGILGNLWPIHETAFIAINNIYNDNIERMIGESSWNFQNASKIFENNNPSWKRV